MTEKELRKLSRRDLLEMLLFQTQQCEELRQKLNCVEQELQKKEITINKSGSIAEAALRLNDVFEAADQAVAQYQENIKRLSENQELMCKQMEVETQSKCQAILAETDKKCKAREQAADAYYSEMTAKIQELYDHQGLQE